MLKNGRLNNGEEVNYAFALINGVYREAKTVSHNGALGGYRAQLLRFPDLQFSVIILSNLESFDTVALAYQVADIYLDEQFRPALAENRNKDNSTRMTQSQDDKETNEKQSQSINLNQQQLNEYSGEYYSDELLSTYKITTDKGKLFVQIKYNSKRELIISDKDVIEGFAKIAFSRDGNDKVSGFTMDAGRIKNIKFFRK
jgi:hypothetical protein